MNEPLDNFRDKLWRRRLSSAEEAELRSKVTEDPQARRDIDADIALTRELNRLPDSPMPSNFTARVMQAIESENVKAARSREFNWKWFVHSVLPRSAVAMLLIGVSLFSYNEVRARQRAELARSVAAVSQVASLPGPDILKDFDAIQHLTPTPPPDTELLALLK